MNDGVMILGLRGFPLVKPGDNIAELVIERARALRIRILDGDILVVGHKIISKSEGRLVNLANVKPTARAIRLARKCSKDPRLVQLILDESRRIIRTKPGIILVETKQRVVCLNAGIDKSNVEGRETYCLLPKNPKGSASRIASDIMRRTKKWVRVIVTDTYSRPFRVGQSEFAIGLTGFEPFADYRGSKDLFGNILMFKRVSIADELACAGELVMGQGAEGIPVAIIRGATRVRATNPRGDSELVMEKERDLFRGAL